MRAPYLQILTQALTALSSVMECRETTHQVCCVVVAPIGNNSYARLVEELLLSATLEFVVRFK